MELTIPRRFHLFLILFILIISLACQAASSVLDLNELPSPTPVAVVPSITPPPTLLPSLTPTASPTLTFTPVPSPSATSTATAIPEPTGTQLPTPAPYQFDVFQDLWQAVNQEYLYADFNGVDWNAVFDEFLGSLQMRDLMGVQVTASGCIGPCNMGPNVLVYPEGVMYQGVKTEDVGTIIDEHLIGGKPVERLLMHEEIWG